MNAFPILLDGEPYEVRYYDERITGATRQSLGVDVRPESLYALADRTKERAALDCALLDALRKDWIAAPARDVVDGMAGEDRDEAEAA